MTMPTIEQRKADLERKAALPSPREAKASTKRDRLRLLWLLAGIAAIAIAAGAFEAYL